MPPAGEGQVKTRLRLRPPNSAVGIGDRPEGLIARQAHGVTIRRYFAEKNSWPAPQDSESGSGIPAGYGLEQV